MIPRAHALLLRSYVPLPNLSRNLFVIYLYIYLFIGLLACLGFLGVVGVCFFAVLGIFYDSCFLFVGFVCLLLFYLLSFCCWVFFVGFCSWVFLGFFLFFYYY